ncbi:MAG: hypothetical protein V3V08_03970 [Nannocystaceae bacterium]
MNPVLAASLAVGSLLSATGCPMVEELVFGRADVSLGDPLPVATARMVDHKLGLYLECHDSLVGPISDSYDRYAEIAGRGELEPRRRQSLFLYRVTGGAFRICTSVRAEVGGLAPPLEELDRISRSFIERARAYADLSQTYGAHLEAPAGDRLATNAYHRALLSAHSDWDNWREVFSAGIEVRQAANDGALLEFVGREGGGEGLEYRSLAVLQGARRVASCAMREGGEADCRNETARFLVLSREFDAYHRAHLDEAEQVFWMRTFASDLPQLRDSVVAYAEAGRVERGRARRAAALARAYLVLRRDAVTLDFEFP